MRDALRTLVGPASPQQAASGHAGLILDRFLTSATDASAKSALLDGVTGARLSSLYVQRYARWRAAIGALPGVALGVFSVAGRVIVGLGNESTLETGITLQQVDGTPFIPGSALKGLSSHYAAQHLATQDTGYARDGDYHQVLFGTTANAGYVSYFDAWYVPGSAPADRPLARDTITVHHPRYYTGGERRRAPWDLDDPNPVPFLSARGKFLVAMQGPDVAWAKLAFAVLSQALADWGVGAKTSSGYGQLELVEDLTRDSPATAVPAVVSIPAVHPFIVELERIPINQMKQQVPSFIQRAENLNEPTRSEVRAAVVRVLRSVPGLWSWAQGRPWWASIAPPDNE